MKIGAIQIEKLETEYEQFIWQSGREAERLEERIEELKEDLGNNELTAPFDGVIDKIVYYKQGDPVSTGEILVSMYATDCFLLETDNALGNLRYNDAVTVETGGKNEKVSYTGRVISASNALPSSLASNPALIRLDEEVSRDKLKRSPQYQCLTQEVSDVIIVDKNAVRNEEGKSYVYMLEDGMMKKRFVITALSGRSENVWILDGLTFGQTVILD